MSHALKDKGYDNRIRRDHESAADALYPSKGGEIWIRPWHLKVARALVDELKAREESAVVCAACSEERAQLIFRAAGTAVLSSNRPN